FHSNRGVTVRRGAAAHDSRAYISLAPSAGLQGLAMQTDVISSVLRAVRLTGAVFFDVAATPPWVAEAPPARELVSRIMPRAQTLMEYHIVVSGSCWAALTSAPEAAVFLDSGSIIVFP